MARAWSTDYLQSHPFWLVDYAPLGAFSLPVLSPFMGFRSITGPEISLDTETVNEGNWFFDKKVVKRGSVSPITLERGVAWWDSDFWRWTYSALTGDPRELAGGVLSKVAGGVASLVGGTTGAPSYRRDLMLVHFFTRTIGDPFTSGGLLGSVERGTLVGAAAAQGGASTATSIGLGGTVTAASAGLAALGLNAFEFAPRIPARIYLLYGCIPSSCKLAGDFDASSADISVASLELQPEMIELKTFEI